MSKVEIQRDSGIQRRAQSDDDGALPYARFALPQGVAHEEHLALPLSGRTRTYLRATRAGEPHAVLTLLAAFAARLLDRSTLELGLVSVRGVVPIALQHVAQRTLAELVEVVQEARAAGGAPRGGYALTVEENLAVSEPLGSGLRITRRTEGWVVVFDASLWPSASVAQFARHLASFADALVGAPSTPIDTLSLLDEGEHARLLRTWNATALKFDDALVLPDAFHAQVARTPSAIALAFDDEELAYAELEARVVRLAQRLRSVGVGPEARVGVYCERSLEMVVAVLAVLHAGGAYVPLDPTFPIERVRAVIDDTGMSVVLAQAHLHADLEGAGVALLDVRDDGVRGLAPFKHRLGPAHLAYVLFTSGSTGRPKGVMVEHQNVANLFAAMDAHLGRGEPGVWLAVTSLSFDISVVELLWSLCRGFKVVLYREPSRDGVRTRSDASFAELARRHGVTHLQCTPTMAHMFLADPAARAEFAGLREIILAGEAYPITLARQLRGLTRATLRNIYGPTETTVYSVGHVVDPESDSVPIGRPLANTTLYVLDARRRPVPVGVPGELYIGGRGVTRGYFGRDDLTAERFVPDTFSDEVGARLYRTGDLVRYREDGTLEFLGRIDHQVKIRGFRMELGEIENVLAQHALVREAVVTVREDIPGNKRLVAYVVANEPLGLTEAALRAELKQHLKQKLPPYMVPSNVVRLDVFPQTTSGKVDRKALPAPEAVRAARGVSANTVVSA